MKDVKKFNIKTQEFETIEYGGYKANRTETPPDLIQQHPYIRRALEAFRIPILFYMRVLKRTTDRHALVPVIGVRAPCVCRLLSDKDHDAAGE